MRNLRRAKISSPKRARRPLAERSEPKSPRLENKHELKTESKAPARIFLVDNYPTFGDGIEQAIAQSKTLQVIGRVSNAEEAFKSQEITSADLVLVDIDLPDQSGLEVCQRLLQAVPTMSVLLISYNDWDIYLLAAQAVHSKGLLLRSQPTIDLIVAVEKAMSGSVFSEGQIDRIQVWRDTTGLKLRSLGKREWQVLQLIALGQSNREIGKVLELTRNTVEKHVSNILQKLGLDSRAMIMVFIYTNHLDQLSRLPHGDRFLMLLMN